MRPLKGPMELIDIENSFSVNGINCWKYFSVTTCVPIHRTLLSLAHRHIQPYQGWEFLGLLVSLCQYRNYPIVQRLKLVHVSIPTAIV